jgi:heme A synthase
MVHGMNGMMIIPILVLLLLIVSFFAKVPGGVRSAAILVGLVVLQVFLGIFAHSVPFVIVLHVLNAFAILGVAAMAGRSASVVAEPDRTSVAV